MSNIQIKLVRFFYPSCVKPTDERAVTRCGTRDTNRTNTTTSCSDCLDDNVIKTKISEANILINRVQSALKNIQIIKKKGKEGDVIEEAIKSIKTEAEEIIANMKKSSKERCSRKICPERPKINEVPTEFERPKTRRNENETAGPCDKYRSVPEFDTEGVSSSFELLQNKLNTICETTESDYSTPKGKRLSSDQSSCVCDAYEEKPSKSAPPSRYESQRKYCVDVGINTDPPPQSSTETQTYNDTRDIGMQLNRSFYQMHQATQVDRIRDSFKKQKVSSVDIPSQTPNVEQVFADGQKLSCHRRDCTTCVANASAQKPGNLVPQTSQPDKLKKLSIQKLPAVVIPPLRVVVQTLNMGIDSKGASENFRQNTTNIKYIEVEKSVEKERPSSKTSAGDFALPVNEDDSEIPCLLECKCKSDNHCLDHPDSLCACEKTSSFVNEITFDEPKEASLQEVGTQNSVNKVENCFKRSISNTSIQKIPSRGSGSNSRYNEKLLSVKKDLKDDPHLSNCTCFTKILKKDSLDKTESITEVPDEESPDLYEELLKEINNKSTSIGSQSLKSADAIEEKSSKTEVTKNTEISKSKILVDQDVPEKKSSINKPVEDYCSDCTKKTSSIDNKPLKSKSESIKKIATIEQPTEKDNSINTRAEISESPPVDYITYCQKMCEVCQEHILSKKNVEVAPMENEKVNKDKELKAFDYLDYCKKMCQQCRKQVPNKKISIEEVIKNDQRTGENDNILTEAEQCSCQVKQLSKAGNKVLIGNLLCACHENKVINLRNKEDKNIEEEISITKKQSTGDGNIDEKKTVPEKQSTVDKKLSEGERLELEEKSDDFNYVGYCQKICNKQAAKEKVRLKLKQIDNQGSQPTEQNVISENSNVCVTCEKISELSSLQKQNDDSENTKSVQEKAENNEESSLPFDYISYCQNKCHTRLIQEKSIQKISDQSKILPPYNNDEQLEENPNEKCGSVIDSKQILEARLSQHNIKESDTRDISELELDDNPNQEKNISTETDKSTCQKTQDSIIVTPKMPQKSCLELLENLACMCHEVIKTIRDDEAEKKQEKLTSPSSAKCVDGCECDPVIIKIKGLMLKSKHPEKVEKKEILDRQALKEQRLIKRSKTKQNYPTKSNSIIEEYEETELDQDKVESDMENQIFEKENSKIDYSSQLFDANTAIEGQKGVRYKSKEKQLNLEEDDDFEETIDEERPVFADHRNLNIFKKLPFGDIYKNFEVRVPSQMHVSKNMEQGEKSKTTLSKPTTSTRAPRKLADFNDRAASEERKSKRDKKLNETIQKLAIEKCQKLCSANLHKLRRLERVQHVKQNENKHSEEKPFKKGCRHGVDFCPQTECPGPPTTVNSKQDIGESTKFNSKQGDNKSTRAIPTKDVDNATEAISKEDVVKTTKSLSKQDVEKTTRSKLRFFETEQVSQDKVYEILDSVGEKMANVASKTKLKQEGTSKQDIPVKKEEKTKDDLQIFKKIRSTTKRLSRDLQLSNKCCECNMEVRDDLKDKGKVLQGAQHVLNPSAKKSSEMIFENDEEAPISDYIFTERDVAFKRIESSHKEFEAHVASSKPALGPTDERKEMVFRSYLLYDNINRHDPGKLKGPSANKIKNIDDSFYKTYIDPAGNSSQYAMSQPHPAPFQKTKAIQTGSSLISIPHESIERKMKKERSQIQDSRSRDIPTFKTAGESSKFGDSKQEKSDDKQLAVKNAPKASEPETKGKRSSATEETKRQKSDNAPKAKDSKTRPKRDVLLHLEAKNPVAESLSEITLTLSYSTSNESSSHEDVRDAIKDKELSVTNPSDASSKPSKITPKDPETIDKVWKKLKQRYKGTDEENKTPDAMAAMIPPFDRSLLNDSSFEDLYLALAKPSDGQLDGQGNSKRGSKDNDSRGSKENGRRSKDNAKRRSRDNSKMGSKEKAVNFCFIKYLPDAERHLLLTNNGRYLDEANLFCEDASLTYKDVKAIKDRANTSVKQKQFAEHHRYQQPDQGDNLKTKKDLALQIKTHQSNIQGPTAKQVASDQCHKGKQVISITLPRPEKFTLTTDSSELEALIQDHLMKNNVRRRRPYVGKSKRFISRKHLDRDPTVKIEERKTYFNNWVTYYVKKQLPQVSSTGSSFKPPTDTEQ